MNQNEFNRQAEIDALHADLQKKIESHWAKYGEESVNDLLCVMFRMEKFITDQR